MSNLKAYFEKGARKISDHVGKPIAFTIAFLMIVVWAITGPIFGFSDTWQLVINTGTTIITFLMIFLVQSAQNRDAKAVQLKLDELIYKLHRANNIMIDIENLSDDELNKLAEKYQRIRQSGDPKAMEDLQKETKAATHPKKAKNGKAKKSTSIKMEAA